MSATSETQTPQLSVIIPVGIRFDDLGRLCAALRGLFAQRPGGYEILFVDDANGPNTREALRKTAREYPEARVIRLQRRMGEAAALSVGAQNARGRILLELDPYLHIAVESLPKLLEPIEKGMDLALAWREPRVEGGLSRMASDAFNAAARWLTKTPVHDLNCRVRAMRREVLDDVPLYGDLHRFLPIFAGRRGWQWCEVQVPQLPGKKEIGAFWPRSYVARFLDLLTLLFLTRFIKRPLHFFGLVGASSLAVGLGLAGYLTYEKLVLHAGIGHRPLLLLAVLLIVIGVQIASIGLLGELMIFTHARDLKDYVIKETIE